MEEEEAPAETEWVVTGDGRKDESFREMTVTSEKTVTTNVNRTEEEEEEEETESNKVMEEDDEEMEEGDNKSEETTAKRLLGQWESEVRFC